MKSTLSLALTVLFGLGGCSTVASSVSGQNNVSGEAWYVKTHHVFGMPVSNTVYYCPAPTVRGFVTCVEAPMIDEPPPAPESSSPVPPPAASPRVPAVPGAPSSAPPPPKPVPIEDVGAGGV